MNRPLPPPDTARAMADLERMRASLEEFIRWMTRRRNPDAAETLTWADKDEWFGAIDRAMDDMRRRA